MQRARPELSSFERLYFWSEASLALLHVLLEHPEQARAELRRVEEALHVFADDAETLRGTWPTLARAYARLGDAQIALKWWELYLSSLHVKPAYRPGALYGLGECHAQLGDLDAARAAWQQATDFGLDTMLSHRSRARLERAREGQGTQETQT